jgi:thiol:disulfide interchange protein DsbD
MLPNDSLSYTGAFLGGLLVSFTPCIYPMIPVVVGYIGARSAKSILLAFRLSLSYCLGVAVSYSILGVFAALTGRIFGLFSVSPVVNIIVGALFVIFGLSVLDVFTIPTLNLLGSRPLNFKPSGFGAFILGMTSGLVISPCVAPVMASILIYISTKKNIFFGATLMFTYAVGMSFMLMLAGTFSSLISKLPKSGTWLEVIKKILGFILIAVGCYFIFLAGRRWL